MKKLSMRRGRRWFSRVIGTLGVLLVFAFVAVGVTVGGTSRVSEAEIEPRAPQAQPVVSISEIRTELTSGLAFAPATGASSVSPSTPIVVTAQTGQLENVRVTASSGATVAGALSVSGDRWRSTGLLAYGTRYRVTASVQGALGVHAAATARFQTAIPAASVGVSVFPSTGITIGVGQPIVFRFSRWIGDAGARASVVAHLSIKESKPVGGGWYWFSNRELHFRPKTFWPTGEQVTVSWNLTGWNAADGAWGDDAGSTHFAVGHARVSYADLATHVMTVTDNGRTVATYPISGGKPTDPTMNGVHIVLDRQSVVHMVSSTNGIPVNSPDGYDELVYDDVHISDTGEYVHAAPWSVGSQGHRNVSHGCINLSPANAKSFFDFSRVGDVVVVTGSTRPPVVGDHGVMDWDTAFSAFVPAKVITPDALHPHIVL